MIETRDRMVRGEASYAQVIRQLYERNLLEDSQRLRAVVELVPFERLMAQAEALDNQAGRGVDLEKQPLLGVPVTIKEHIAVEGMKLTFGVETPAPASTRDATLVARLRRAGALVLGKTNVSDWGLSYDTASTHYGRTVNPVDECMSSGGSSGGEAAAVAAQLSLGGIGGDVGGGIRISAAFCGVLGLRPTPGRVPQTGIGTRSFLDKGLIGQFSCYGPIGTCVEDLELMLRVISGPDFHDPHCITGAYTANFANVNLQQLRVGYSFGSTLHSAARVAVQSAARALQGHVAHLQEINVDHLHHVGLPLAARLFGVDAGDAVAALAEKYGTSPHVSWHMDFVKNSRCHDAMDVLALVNDVNRFASDLISIFRDVDVWICPVTDAGTAIKPEQCFDFANIIHTLIVSMGKVPAGVVGSMTADEVTQLPAAVQIVAPPLKEDVVLAVMKLLHQSAKKR